MLNESHFKNYMLRHIWSLPSCLFMRSFLLDLFCANEHFAHMYVYDPHVPVELGGDAGSPETGIIDKL